MGGADRPSQSPGLGIWAPGQGGLDLGEGARVTVLMWLVACMLRHDCGLEFSPLTSQPQEWDTKPLGSYILEKIKDREDSCSECMGVTVCVCVHLCSGNLELLASSDPPDSVF